MLNLKPATKGGSGRRNGITLELLFLLNHQLGAISKTTFESLLPFRTVYCAA